MSDFEALKIIDFDHIEFAVDSLESAVQLYTSLGFKKHGEREILERKLKSYLMCQGGIKIVLSQSQDPGDVVAKYVSAHGPGCINVAFLCEDVVTALELVTQRGAKTTNPPKTYKRDFGSVEQASIAAFGDVHHTFISRQGNLFAEGFDTPLESPYSGYGLKRIDHITNNVEMGKMEEWAEFYQRVFGLRVTRFFDIHTNRTGLKSKVMESPNGIIKMPINEPTETESQIQEFLDVHHGAGIQHIALTSTNIVASLTELRKQSLNFLEVPSTYYEDIPARVPDVTEDLKDLEKLGILVDGDEKGYLLQIFTHSLVGPFFYEVIQRKGNDGFGEGNFQALFEAIERDQVQRGALKPA